MSRPGVSARSNFQVYDSIHEFVNMPVSKEAINYYANRKDEWTGPRNMQESRDYFIRGADESELRDARELMNKIDVEVHGHVGEQWIPQVYGAYPVVPDYLSGDPMCMRSKAIVEMDTAPLRVVLNISVAAGMNANTIARRAAAAAAFTMKLSERRAVELWISSAFCNENMSTDIGYRVKLDMPMNLSQVIAAYNRSVCRVLNFPVLEMLSNMGNVDAPLSHDGYAFTLKGSSAYEKHQRVNYMKAFREYQNLADDDIVLDAGILTDCDEIDANPVKWVKDMLAKYGEATED